MRDTREHGERLHAVASILIEGHANLALCDETGYTACSLMMQSHGGLHFLQSFVYRFVDLFTLEEMASSDAWIMASLARTLPMFRSRLEAELRSYSTAPQLACRQHRKTKELHDLDISFQVREVRQASPTARTTFLQSLCANGTQDMIQPYIDAGVDLDEVLPGKNSTYACLAAKHGNFDILLALIKAGASQSVEKISRIGDSDGPVGELLERWFSLRSRRPEYFGCPDEEDWVLPVLLLSDKFDKQDVLFRALNTRQPAKIFRYLLDAGCGRRDGFPAQTWKQQVYGSEVIEAVKCRDRNIEMLLDHRLALECHDSTGFTALLYALDRGPGPVDFVKLLVGAGADVKGRTPSGLTPLQQAEKNVRQPHPRMPRLTRTINKASLTVHAVSMEDDLAALQLIRSAIAERKSTAVATQGTWRSSGSSGGFKKLKTTVRTGSSNKQAVYEYVAGLSALALMTVLMSVLAGWRILWGAVRKPAGRVD